MAKGRRARSLSHQGAHTCITFVPHTNILYRTIWQSPCAWHVKVQRNGIFTYVHHHQKVCSVCLAMNSMLCAYRSQRGMCPQGLHHKRPSFV